MDPQESVATIAAPSTSSSPFALSESWAVSEKHSGCYTGGKVHWSESSQVLGCLCSEELQLVDINTREASTKVGQEGDGILTFALDPAGQNACTSHGSGLLRHWKLTGEKPEAVRAWRAHEQLVADVCFDASGGFVASGSVDRTVRVWDFSGYFCTHNFKGHTSLINIVRFHPARLQLVSVAEVEVRLWDLQSSSCIAVMRDHLASISSLSFGKVKGTTYNLITAGRDQVVNVWSLEGKCPLSKSIPAFENVEGVAAVPTKGLKQASSSIQKKDPFLTWLQGAAELPAYVLLTVGDKCQLRVWNPADGRCLKKQASPHAAKGLFRQVHCLDQVNGRKIVTIGEDLNVVVWSLPEFEVVNYIMGHNEEIVHVQLIPELSWSEPEPPEASAATLSTSRPALQASAKRFVAIANDEHPRVVNCHGFGASLLRGHTDVVIACDVSPDGKWIATGGKDQSIRIWSAIHCCCVCILAGHVQAISALSFAKKRPKSAQADSSTQPLCVVSGSLDKTMKVWELPKVQQLEGCIGKKAGSEAKVDKSKTTVVAHSKEVSDVVVSPNNKLIASGGQDKLVRIWKYPSAELLGECKGHRRGIWCVAFHPSDQVLASASGDSTVRLWNLKDYSAIRAFQGHGSAVLRVAFLSNGMQLMTSGVDGLLKLWQIRTAECAGTYEEHEGKVWCIDVLGDTMVSGGSDSKLCVWKDTTEAEGKKRHDEKAEAAMKDSRIGMLVQQGKIEVALGMALDLNRPGQMQTIITDYALGAIGKSVERAEGGEAQEAPDEEKRVDLQRWVNSLNESRLEKLVELVERWNSNRRMAAVAHMFMGLILAAVPPAKLTKLEGMNATCQTILSYSSRHMARVESLLQKTFLFDLVLQSSSQGLALQDEMDLAAGGKKSSNNASAESALKSTMAVLLGPVEDEEEERVIKGPGQTAPVARQLLHPKGRSSARSMVVEESDDEPQGDKTASPSTNGAADEKRPKKKRRKSS